MLNFWGLIKAVEEKQKVREQYLHLYEQGCLGQTQQNEFLSDVEQPCFNDSEIKSKPTQDLIAKRIEYEYRKQSTSSPLVHKKLDLSQIFEEIVLDQKLMHKQKFEVELQFEGKIVKLFLKKDVLYSLSNFSSFNNNKAKKSEDHAIEYEFKDILEEIQIVLNKQLNQKGIANVIRQLSLTVKDLIAQSQINSKVTEIPTFQDQRGQKDKIKCNDSILAINKNVVNLGQRRQNFTKRANQKINFDRAHQKGTENKENIEAHDKKGLKIQKQLRIIRKNHSKNSCLIMLYMDLKQVQHFCISNKIYDKEKQKIVRAVQSNKHSIILD